ncbi:hypothetical protein BDW22DRAFT_1426926 [Trametopsis cervina]|nr:hypothetical protein BDW22DRAFT_1426926 [Trametopsis cervina]
MPSSDPEALNASGLTPVQSKALKERSVEPHETKIIEAVKELYTSSPKESTYSVYAQNAVFHDPVGIAEGIGAIREQFNGLAKLFPRADIPRFKVLENPSSLPKSTILIDQDVSYYRDPNATSPTKTVNSLLTIETDGSQKITRHTEEWDHQRETTSEDGFLGMLNEQRKKWTASLTGAFISQEPPNK